MRIVVGLSGGVDSSVAAYLLKEQGHDVIGLFMRNWNDANPTLEDECPWIEDSRDAMLVADKLGIPFQVLDLSETYKKRIVDYMFTEYEKGFTPNPDVLCNREIKFDIFLNEALKLGAEAIATGHYVQKKITSNNGIEIHHLFSGADKNKDQSYFLCQLNQFQLSKALFPIGHLQKSEVRKIASEQQLVTADKKDSQGLCFIGQISLPTFLQQQLKPKKGNVIEIVESNPKIQSYLQICNDPNATLTELVNKPIFTETDGQVIGTHNGAHFYTIGQRKGINIGGKPLPLFVIQINTQTNTVYVGQGENHLGLLSKALLMKKNDVSVTNVTNHLSSGEKLQVQARIRYRQALFDAVLHNCGDNYYLAFVEMQKAVAKGQFAAWYLGEELIGSGVIQ